MRGEVFIDLWLGDAETGKRITRLVKSTFDPNFEELRLLYSQSAFSPDGRQLAFTAQREGRDVLYLLDVKSHKELKRFDLPLEAVTGPSWSPDGKRIVFSGSNGGLTDLYIVDVETSHLERLTNDRYGDLQPQWSPDGKVIAFAGGLARARAAEQDRFRQRPWRYEQLYLSALSEVAYHPARPREGHNHGAPQPGRIEYQSAVVARRTLHRLRLRSDRYRQRLPLRLRLRRAVSIDERRRIDFGDYGVQSGNQLGAKSRPSRLHLLRERRVHDLVGGESAWPQETALPRQAGGKESGDCCRECGE